MTCSSYLEAKFTSFSQVTTKYCIHSEYNVYIITTITTSALVHVAHGTMSIDMYEYKNSVLLTDVNMKT